MSFITGQEVFNEYLLDYEKIAQAIINRKIKAYNLNHNEILDANILKKEQKPCANLTGNELLGFFPVKAQFCYLEISTDEYFSTTPFQNQYNLKLENTDNYFPLNSSLYSLYKKDKTYSYIKINYLDTENREYVPTKYFEIIDDNTATEVNISYPKSTTEREYYAHYQGFLFPQYLYNYANLQINSDNDLNYSDFDKNNFPYTINRIKLPNTESPKTFSIPFTCHFYNITDSLLNKFNKNRDKLCKLNIDIYYNKINSSELLPKMKNIISNFLEIIPNSTHFYNYIKEHIEYILKSYDDNINSEETSFSNLKNNFEIYKKHFTLDFFIANYLWSNIRNQVLSLGDLPLEPTIKNLFLYLNLLEIIKHTSNDNKIKTGYDLYQLLVKEKILHKKSINYELIITDNIFYLQEKNTNKIISCNKHQMIKISDDFSKEFNNIEEEIIKMYKEQNRSTYNHLKDKQIQNEIQNIKNLFEEKRTYQKIFRYNYKDKKYKTDYYYFDKSTFLSFYPKEYSDEIEKITFKKDIYSFGS